MTMPLPYLHSLVLGPAHVEYARREEKTVREEIRDWLDRLSVQSFDTLVLPDAPNGGTDSSSRSLKTEQESSDWMDAKEAAHFLRISLGALRNETSNGHIPHAKLGRRVRYSRNELQALLLANRRGGV